MQHSNRHTVTAYIPALILCYSAQFTDSVTMPVILTSPCEWAGALGTCTVAMATADSLCNVWAHYHIHKKLDPLGTFDVSAIIDIIDLHAQATKQTRSGKIIQFQCMGRHTFSLLLLSSDGVHPLLLVVGRLGYQHKPLVLGHIVHLPTVVHHDAICVVVGCKGGREGGGGRGREGGGRGPTS